MSKRAQRGEAEERFVAVYPDEHSARRAAEAARARGAGEIAIDDPTDEVRAVLGEQREAISKAWIGPSVGAYTPEMVRQVPWWTALGALVGLLVALPLGMIEMGGMSQIGRFAIAGLCGATAGGTIGFLAGGFAASRRQTHAPLAGEHGTVVGLTAGGDGPVKALSDERPLRVDRVVGMQATDTVTSGQRSLEPEGHAWDIPDSDDPDN